MGSRKGLFILGFYFTESLIVNLQHLLVKPADRQTKYVNYADRGGQNIPNSVDVIYGCPLTNQLSCRRRQDVAGIGRDCGRDDRLEGHEAFIGLAIVLGGCVGVGSATGGGKGGGLAVVGRAEKRAQLSTGN